MEKVISDAKGAEGIAALGGDPARVIFSLDETASTEQMIKYMPLVKVIASQYRNLAEYEDLVQEGAIGLFYAVHCYQKERKVSFSTFARVCIRRRIFTALKTLTKQPCLSLSDMEEEYEPLELQEGPEALCIRKEELAFCVCQIKSLLSRSEQDMLKLYLGGCSYEEMAQKLHSTVKSVDNALQRIRRKLRLVTM